MAAPTSYTEQTLADFMLTCLQDVATQLGWTALADVQEAINETLLAYGVTTIAGATDIRKLRALARREVWHQVASATAGDYDFTADGATYNRSQVHAQALQEFQAASADAGAFEGFQVEATAVEYEHDPYGPEALNAYQDW